MIVVTGGAGFIGSNIVRGLNLRGETDILIVDNLGKGDKYKNLIGLKFHDYIHMDDFMKKIEDDEFFLTEDIDVIFHEGACSDTMEYDVNYMMKVNYEYSKKLLDFCTDEDIKFIYASSASTYGDGQNGFREDDDCENALNPYAFSKLLFDRYVRNILANFDEDFSPPSIIGLRYFNVYGAQEQHKGRMASIVYQMYQNVKNTGIIKLFKGSDGYADGEQRRDFISVEDVVKVNLWAYDDEDIVSGIYNCGTGKAHTFNEVAQAVIKALGKGKVQYIDFPDELQGKYQSFTQADTRNLLRAGYDGGFVDFEKSIADYCKFLDNGGYFFN
ncbi:MAG: ADP-glyceromanno-heptose 6-epimerase [Selenomonadaceae bacterium]|nr:ADP-glyceromanno-heptose 6-epimerase [Selenomonadaceae bacterium]